MVKEHAHSEVIPHCTVKDFFEILYADSAAAKAYHKQVDRDENATVENWEGNTRTVHFTMPMQLPAVLKKIIGSDTIPVKEIQQATTDGTGALHITSTPIIGVPGGSNFRAVAQLTVSNMTLDGTFGCKVSATVTCTANGPWGFQGMVEGVMVEQSAASVKTYLDFCIARCRTAITTVPQVLPLTDGLTEELGSPRSDVTAFDQFFDAQEVLSRQSSGVSSSGLILGPSTAEVVDMVALISLLDTLDGRLVLLSSDLAAVRALIPTSAATTPAPAKSLRPARRPNFASLLLGIAVGAAAVATACLFALKRQRVGGL